jgi:hypothetical protein
MQPKLPIGSYKLFKSVKFSSDKIQLLHRYLKLIMRFQKNLSISHLKTASGLFQVNNSDLYQQKIIQYEKTLKVLFPYKTDLEKIIKSYKKRAYNEAKQIVDRLKFSYEPIPVFRQSPTISPLTFESNSQRIPQPYSHSFPSSIKTTPTAERSLITNPNMDYYSPLMDIDNSNSFKQQSVMDLVSIPSFPYSKPSKPTKSSTRQKYDHIFDSGSSLPSVIQRFENKRKQNEEELKRNIVQIAEIDHKRKLTPILETIKKQRVQPDPAVKHKLDQISQYSLKKQKGHEPQAMKRKFVPAHYVEYPTVPGDQIPNPEPMLVPDYYEVLDDPFTLSDDEIDMEPPLKKQTTTYLAPNPDYPTKSDFEYVNLDTGSPVTNFTTDIYSNV